MSENVRLVGADELTAAFLRLSEEVRKELTPTLAEAADPVSAAAAQNAMSNIRNETSRWSTMKVGIKPSLVYVAPKAHRAGGSPRPNLAPLLMDKAMQPALDDHTDEVVAKLEAVLDTQIRTAGF